MRKIPKPNRQRPMLKPNLNECIGGNMKNLDVLKQEISKCNTSEEFFDILEEFRFMIFPCRVNGECLMSKVSCECCYSRWLDKEI